MTESSSNPPILNNSSTTPPSLVSDTCIIESQPSTADILVGNGLLRDTWVNLRRKFPVPETSNPKKELAKKVLADFRKQGVHLDIAQVSETLEMMLEKHLLEYYPDSRCFAPTKKTQRLMNELFIVICDNCGASNIKLREKDEEIQALLFCHRCEEIV